MQTVAYIIFIFVAWYAVGCTSPSRRSADNAVLEHQQQLTELEGRNQDLERRLAQYDDTVGDSIKQLEAIRTRGIGMEGTIDETIRLFDEYQRAVEQLTRAYRALQDAANDGINVGATARNSLDN
jgi:chromosome segregation ATPase